MPKSDEHSSTNSKRSASKRDAKVAKTTTRVYPDPNRNYVVGSGQPYTYSMALASWENRTFGS